MTRTAAPAPARPAAGRRPGRTLPLALEAGGSVLAGVAVLGVLATWLDANLAFLGAQAVASADDVRSYWAWVVVLGLAVVLSWSGAVWRGAGGAFVWHVLVALVGVVVATVFSVTTVGPRETPRPAPDRDDAGRHAVCLSGGDSRECVGG